MLQNNFMLYSSFIQPIFNVYSGFKQITQIAQITQMGCRIKCGMKALRQVQVQHEE